MTCVRLLLGDQLNPRHPWFARTDADVLYVLMEVRQETDYVLHHAQKILAIFAAMRRFAAQLRAAGHRVGYLAIDDAANLQSLTGNLDRLLAVHAATTLEYQQPDEWRLDAQLRQLRGRAVDPGALRGQRPFPGWTRGGGTLLRQPRTLDHGAVLPAHAAAPPRTAGTRRPAPGGR